jgi:hypothetical protein
VLFAAMSGSVQTVVIESVVMTLFAAVAVAGFKSSGWIVVAALAGLVSRVRRRRSSQPRLAHKTPARRLPSTLEIGLTRTRIGACATTPRCGIFFTVRPSCHVM